MSRTGRIKNIEKRIKELKIEKKKIIRENNRRKNIRNLKLFGTSLKLISPCVLVSSFCFGIIYNISGNTPFKLDDRKKYKMYDVNLNNEQINITSDYDFYSGFDDKRLNININMITPFEKNDSDKYERTIYEYKTDIDKNLCDAIISGDTNYIFDNLEPIKTEIQTNNILTNDNNQYTINTNFKYIDYDDTITVKEDELGNIIMTTIELLIPSALFFIVCKLGYSKYKVNFQEIIDECKLESFNSYNEKITILQKKLSKLKR